LEPAQLTRIKRQLKEKRREPAFDLELIRKRDPKRLKGIVSAMFEEMGGEFGRHRLENYLQS
jgi:hypothetical protein